MKISTITAALTVLSLAASLPASLSGQSLDAWYIGVGGSQSTLRWEPQYTLIADPSERFAAFDNREDAVGLELLVGGDVVARGRFRLAIDGSVSTNAAKWTLELDDEPASFEYRQPFTALLTAKPGLQVTERGRVFLAGGLGAGRVQETKTSPSADRSSYDDRRLNGVFTYGAGAELGLGATLALRVEYRAVQHTRFEYETRLPSGTRLERISDAPSMSGVTLTLLRRWSR